MKKIGFLFLAVTLFCSVSCEQQFDMLTVVNEDASFYREFSAQANDDFMLGKTRVKKLEKTNNNPFPVDIDSTWTISWIYKNTISG
ncbi:MAG: hypothetical protein LBT27_01080, partial [Prevotellaceae bacterium]|nr:hypothetical protein [Prevotellaceae bacterium]